MVAIEWSIKDVKFSFTFNIKFVCVCNTIHVTIGTLYGEFYCFNIIILNNRGSIIENNMETELFHEQIKMINSLKLEIKSYSPWSHQSDEEIRLTFRI